MNAIPSRPLGFTETAFTVLHETTGSHVIQLAVSMRTAVDPSAIAQAMEMLVRRHPMLRVGLARGARGYRFEPLAAPRPACEVLSARDGHDMDSVITAHETLVFSEGAPLYRVVFIVDPDRSRTMFVWFSHHAISDGLSVDAVTSEICDLLHGVVAGHPAPAIPERELPAALEQRVAGWRRPLPFFSFLARDALAGMGARRPRHGSTAGGARRPHGLLLLFSPEQTARIKARARGAEVGFGDLLGAGMLKATAAEHGADGAAVRIPYYVPIDCRAQMQGGVAANRKILGLATHTPCWYPPVRRDETALDLARRLRARLSHPDLAAPGPTLVDRFPASLMRAVLRDRCTRSKAFQHGVAFTHAGRHKVPLRELCRPEARFGNMTVKDGCLLMSGISTLNAGCLLLALSYTVPLLDDAAAERFAQRVAQEVGEPEPARTTRSFTAVFAALEDMGTAVAASSGREPAPALDAAS
ncbi:phthiocerol/phthiodiolone dimycocerosyl transferase family protein [Xanthobacter sediminis]